MQWLSSEREKKSVVPPMFWYFSIGGALVLLSYAIHKQDLVFTIGQSSGLFIYARNLQLIRNERIRIAECEKNSDAMTAGLPTAAGSRKAA